MIKVSAAAIGALLLVALLVWFGGQSIGPDVLRAGWAIPANCLIHLCQLFCAACAWRLLIGDWSVSRFAFLRWRVIREAINSLLPVAQIGGPLAAIRLMMRSGIPGAVAVAGTTLDLTVEAATQLPFTFAGIGLLNHEGITPHWLPWVEGGLAALALGVFLFVLAQRAGVMRLIGRLLDRLKRFFPRLSIDGLQEEILRMQRDPVLLAKAASLQFLSWSGGTAEVMLALTAMGHPVTIPHAFIIESLAMAVRSAAFAMPGALGVQEGGFILVGGLFGIGPDTALALSMVKRLRELIIGGAGLILWQWSELTLWREKP